MGTLARAFRVVALLLGFYALCVLLVVGLVVVDIVVVRLVGGRPGLGRLVVAPVVATLAVTLVVLRGVLVSTRVKVRDLPGIPVSRAEQPMLWGRVTALAAAAGTRPPTEVRLIPATNAGVMEQSHALGLLPGRRRMMIGVPLLLTLSPAQFDAVIGHELGHYSGRDVRLGPLTARARSGVLAALRAARGKQSGRGFQWPGQDFFAGVFELYARLVLRSTQATSRAQEYAADRFAASIAGRANAAAALRELPVIEASYNFYLDRYVAAGMHVGLLPPPADLLGGFVAFVRDPKRSAEMAALRDEPAEESTHEFDSHPPTAERVAAILALPDDGRPLDEASGSAVGLLANPAPVLAALGLRTLGDQATGKTAAGWDAIALAARTAAAAGTARPLADATTSVIGRPARLVDFLDLVDAGRLGAVLDKLPPAPDAVPVNATGPAAREFARTSAAQMLGGWLVSELIGTGVVAVRHSWRIAPGELVMPDGLAAALQSGIDAVVGTDVDTSPLRRALPVAGSRYEPVQERRA